MKTSSMLFASLAVVAACGGGKKDPPINLIDAPMNTIDAAPPCTGPAAFAAPTAYLDNTYGADTDPDTTGSQEGWRVIAPINADALPDLIWIELYEGPPPAYTTANFPATPFTIQLTGAELNYFTCSTCISLTTDQDDANMAYADHFMATGGSVTITTLSPTMITGTVDNLTFKQVDFDFDTDMQTDAPTACTVTQSGSIPFTTPVAEPPPDPPFAPNGRRGIAIRGNFTGTQRL